VRTDRFRSPPDGLAGGGTARPGAWYRITSDGVRIDIPSKAANVRINQGDAFVVETSGGGGVGNPLQRAVDRVAADVRSRRVSRAAALDDYGVVIGDDGTIDHEATCARRP